MIYHRVLNFPVYTVEPCYLSSLLKILKEEEGEEKVGEKEMGTEGKKSFYQYILLSNPSSRNKETEKALHCDSPW